MNIKEKLEDVKMKSKEKIKDAARKAVFATEKFYYDHEDEIRKWAPIVVPGAIGSVKLAMKHRKREEERRYADCRHWDPRKGTYYWSKRPLKSRELLELDRLYDQGYSKGEALRRMGLLRY